MSRPASLWDKILVEVFQKEIYLKSFRMISGGGPNQTVQLETDQGSFFAKTNSDSNADIFTLEIKGLDYLRRHTFLKIPKIFGTGKIEAQNYLLMEWIPSGEPVKDYWEDLGRGLATLHQTTAKKFGLAEDNYIAVLPQVNTEHDHWSDFFIENRLEKMVVQAASNGLLDKDLLGKLRKLYSQLPSVFPKEVPSLLHGDLWSGNVLVTGKGRPCLIDPAVYFGHREMDLAFSRLFGGFSTRFYQAYQEVLPVEPGFEDRLDLYNLYPLLVHLNLFGKSYLSSVEKVIKKFVD